MAAPIRYAELELSLRAVGPGAYRADLRLRHPASGEVATLARDVSVALRAADLRAALPDYGQYGRLLTAMLFAEPALREGWVQAAAFTRRAGEGLRLLLDLDPGDPELHGVCWETLCDPQDQLPIARKEAFTLARVIAHGQAQVLTTPRLDQLRALVAVANPANLPTFGLQPIDVPAEVARAQAALTPLPVTVLDGLAGRARATAVNLGLALREGVDLLLLICHGSLVDGAPHLWLEDDVGQADRVPAQALAERLAALAPAHRPRLIVLAACYGATGDASGQTLRAAGPLLAGAGIGAVIAMQATLPVATAERLLPALIRELRRDGQIDRALAAARFALAADDPWWAPTLFLRLRDGRLWEAASASPKTVFLSYKRDHDPDDPLAQRLDAALRAAGHTVLIDRRLPIGVNWAQELNRQIASSDAVIVLLSPQSVRSEMVLAEVFYAQRCKVRLLPVRVAYTDRLPYSLGLALDPIQYALWNDPTDDLALVQQLLGAIDRLDELPSPELGSKSVDHLASPPLYEADPTFSEGLRDPKGAVTAGSPFYVARTADVILQRQLVRDERSITTIRAPRQCGKTSLLIAGIAQARAHQHTVVLIDLQRAGIATETLDQFTRWVADTIAQRLRIDLGTVDQHWAQWRQLTPTDRLTYLLADVVLPKLDGNLVLALDEVDRLIGLTYRSSFFGALRAWYNEGAYEPIWSRLRIALVISTEPLLLIPDPNQSPFNVATQIDLVDFTAAQVRTLAEHYRIQLDDQHLHAFLDLLGGHPYLTHKACYTLATTPGLSWEAYLALIQSDASPLADHLRYMSWLLHDRPQLQQALREVCTSGRCADAGLFDRLLSAGLVRGASHRSCAPRCTLYADQLLRDLP